MFAIMCAGTDLTAAPAALHGKYHLPDLPPFQNTVNTRFAPSPTGLLHVGHAVAAIVAHDLARQTGGQFFLRIDDLDATRCRPEFEAAIYEDLRWLGLDWNVAVRRQSECLAEYAAALDRLRARGMIYACFCTRREIVAEASRAMAAPHGMEGPAYPGTCRRRSSEEVHARTQKGEMHALRLDCAKAMAGLRKPLTFQEHGEGPGAETGEIQARPDMLGDIVLARGGPDGVAGFSYHLAVVIDDAAQNIGCVSRGRDLFFATHAQRLLQEMLEIPVPHYLHHALAVDDSGKRLAKRHDALSLRHLREQGLPPAQVRAMVQAVVN